VREEKAESTEKRNKNRLIVWHKKNESCSETPKHWLWVVVTSCMTNTCTFHHILCDSSYIIIHSFKMNVTNLRVFNRNLNRWKKFRNRRRMNYSRLVSWGVEGYEKFWKNGPLIMHFLHSGARLGVFERNRKHKSLLKLLRIQARSLLNQGLCFVANAVLETNLSAK